MSRTAPSPDRASAGLAARLLSRVERIGNRLPDPVTLFAAGALAVLAASQLAVWGGWTVPHPTEPDRMIEARSLLTSDGLRWVFTTMVGNFTSFHPLGVVLVAMLGIGVAERSGLIAVLLRGLVAITPRMLVTPSLVFVGVLSSLAADAGYVVLPPLAAAIFAGMGRAPLAGLAAVFVGVAGGFSANLVVTSLDPLLQGLTLEASTLMDPESFIASTGLVTLVGWAVTAWIVEPRFTPEEVRTQIDAGRIAAREEENGGSDRVTAAERRGLAFAAIGFAIAAIGLGLMIALPGAPLHG
ncbi:MAG: AbgT family transporter, partial [Planctomycetota bacterium]